MYVALGSIKSLYQLDHHILHSTTQAIPSFWLALMSFYSHKAFWLPGTSKSISIQLVVYNEDFVKEVQPNAVPEICVIKCDWKDLECWQHLDICLMGMQGFER